MIDYLRNLQRCRLSGSALIRLSNFTSRRRIISSLSASVSSLAGLAIISSASASSIARLWLIDSIVFIDQPLASFCYLGQNFGVCRFKYFANLAKVTARNALSRNDHARAAAGSVCLWRLYCMALMPKCRAYKPSRQPLAHAVNRVRTSLQAPVAAQAQILDAGPILPDAPRQTVILFSSRGLSLGSLRVNVVVLEESQPRPGCMAKDYLSDHS